MTVIKSITEAKFRVELVENSKGRYLVRYEQNEKTTTCEPVVDYLVATMLFDIKLQELQGH